LRAVAEVVWRYRVRPLGRFAANYRGLYRELPLTFCGQAHPGLNLRRLWMQRFSRQSATGRAFARKAVGDKRGAELDGPPVLYSQYRFARDWAEDRRWADRVPLEHPTDQICYQINWYRNPQGPGGSLERTDKLSATPRVCHRSSIFHGTC